MERSGKFENNDLNMEATELRLGLPGRDEQTSTTTSTKSNKRSLSEMETISPSTENKSELDNAPPPSKEQVVGWPPVRSYRKNALQQKKTDKSDVMFVKVSMDGAPYLRKIDLKGYKSYQELLNALENMFKCGTFGSYSEREGYYGSEFAPTYEDKDGDWMLVGDVPWDMFINSCKRLRIIKGSEAKGLGCSL